MKYNDGNSICAYFNWNNDGGSLFDLLHFLAHGVYPPNAFHVHSKKQIAILIKYE